MSVPGALSGGAPPPRSAATWRSTPWSRPSTTGSWRGRWCTTAIAGSSIWRSATLSASPRPASSPQWAAGAIPTDNALAETVIGLYKTEVIRQAGPWRGLEDVEYATLEWVAWYNTQRLLEPLATSPRRSTKRSTARPRPLQSGPGTQLTEPPEKPGRFTQAPFARLWKVYGVGVGQYPSPHG
jgi:Integrase core domain